MKKIIALLSFVFLLTGSIFAYSEESADVHAHYEHPITGIIEDSGNNVAIGQGMCENVLHERALIEEVDGQLYACVRYNMADSIENVSFAVQNRNDEHFMMQAYQVLNEGDDTRDYRFKIPAKDAIVRSSLFVGPMEREVIFYFDFSDFVTGDTDFIPLGDGGVLENLQGLEGVAESDRTIEVKAVNDLMNSGDLGYEHGLLMKNSPEIRALFQDSDSENAPVDKSENDNKNKSEKKQVKLKKREWGFMTKTIFHGFVMLIVILTAFSIISAVLLYAFSKYLRKINILREEEIYEED